MTFPRVLPECLHQCCGQMVTFRFFSDTANLVLHFSSCLPWIQLFSTHLSIAFLAVVCVTGAIVIVPILDRHHVEKDHISCRSFQTH